MVAPPAFRVTVRAEMSSVLPLYCNVPPPKLMLLPEPRLLRAEKITVPLFRLTTPENVFAVLKVSVPEPDLAKLPAPPMLPLPLMTWFLEALTVTLAGVGFVFKAMVIDDEPVALSSN